MKTTRGASQYCCKGPHRLLKEIPSVVQHAQTQGTFDGPGSGLYVMTDCKQAPKLVRTMQLKDADGEAAPSTVVSSRGTSAERHPPDLLHKECSDYKEAESVAILRSKNLGLSPDRSCPQ